MVIKYIFSFQLQKHVQFIPGYGQCLSWSRIGEIFSLWWSVCLDVDSSCVPSAFPLTLGKTVDIFDGEEGPYEVVSHVDALDTSGFDGETCCAVEISE